MPRSNPDRSREKSGATSNNNDDRDKEVDSVFARSIMSKLNQIRKNETTAYKSCDLALRVEDRTLCLHELIATMHCDEDSLLFKNNGPYIEGSKMKLVTIPDSTYVGASLMLDYFYTGRTRLNFTNALLVMRVASMVKANSLVRICCDFINKSVLSQTKGASNHQSGHNRDSNREREQRSRGQTGMNDSTRGHKSTSRQASNSMGNQRTKVDSLYDAPGSLNTSNQPLLTDPNVLHKLLTQNWPTDVYQDEELKLSNLSLNQTSQPKNKNNDGDLKVVI